MTFAGSENRTFQKERILKFQHRKPKTCGVSQVHQWLVLNWCVPSIESEILKDINILETFFCALTNGEIKELFEKIKL